MVLRTSEIASKCRLERFFEFLSYWRRVCRGVQPTLSFDSRVTSRPKLSELNDAGVKFITLRCRGADMIAEVDQLEGWQRSHIPRAKRKFPHPGPRLDQLPERIRRCGFRRREHPNRSIVNSPTMRPIWRSGSQASEQWM
ncbi:hypothetical protein ACFL5O_08080 [Myxococcota bacterium]